MKLYGVGAIKDPSTGKVLWDFEDGPFETEDPAIIEAMKAREVKKQRPVEAEPGGTIAPIEDPKESLVEKATELNIAAPSVLKRWSVDRLEREIADAENKGE